MKADKSEIAGYRHLILNKEKLLSKFGIEMTGYVEQIELRIPVSREKQQAMGIAGEELRKSFPPVAVEMAMQKLEQVDIGLIFAEALLEE